MARQGSPAVIEEIRRANAEMARMRKILDEGQRIAHLGSWEYLAASQETVWSDEEFRIYGLQPGGRSPSYAELLDKHIHPEDAAKLDTAFRRCLQDHSPFEIEHRIVTPDGAVRWVCEVAHPEVDPTGGAGPILRRDVGHHRAQERGAGAQEIAGDGRAACS